MAKEMSIANKYITVKEEWGEYTAPASMDLSHIPMDRPTSGVRGDTVLKSLPPIPSRGMPHQKSRNRS